MGLMRSYLNMLGDKHITTYLVGDPRVVDFRIRTFIGKSEDIEKLKVGLCSHQAILERERDMKGIDPEKVCRKCGINLDCLKMRCNDYLVLRNPFCRGPICIDCIKLGGDIFYQSFRKGVEIDKALFRG